MSDNIVHQVLAKLPNSPEDVKGISLFIVPKFYSNENGHEIKNDIKVIKPGCNYPILINQNSKDRANEIFKDAFPKIITVSRLDKRKGHQNILMTFSTI